MKYVVINVHSLVNNLFIPSTSTYNNIRSGGTTTQEVSFKFLEQNFKF